MVETNTGKVSESETKLEKRDFDISPYLQFIGARISEARAEANLSQSAVTEAIGLNATTQSVYENGRKSPSLKTVLRYAELFNKPPAYFFPDASLPDSDSSLNSIRMKIILNSAKLGPVYLELLNEIAVAFLNYDETKGATRLRTLLDVAAANDKKTKPE